tara:strand:+ start:190 stop:357 length:168 start_codon:yes stop_codon:yes gene_type:complete
MKVKLIKGERLSFNMNHCGLSLEDWTALNQGRQVELDTIPDLIKDKIATDKKGDK